MKGWLTDGGHPLYVVWRGSEKDKKRSSQRGEEKSLKEDDLRCARHSVHDVQFGMSKSRSFLPNG
jgi:hypothetical protein